MMPRSLVHVITLSLVLVACGGAEAPVDEAADLAPAQDSPSAIDFEATVWVNGIEVGSHTERHPILSEEDPAEQLRDLETARRRLQSELGVDAALLAYPNGGPEDVNGSAVDAAVRVGHTHGLTTTGGINTPGTDPFSIRRILITPARGTHVLGPLRRRIVARAVRMTKGPRAH